MKSSLVFLVCLLSLVSSTAAQTAAPRTQADPLSTGMPYVLAPGDQITLQAANAEEVSGKTFRVETDGSVDFPLLGLMHPGGLTVEQFEFKVRSELAKYVRDPQVTVSVTQFRSETVTFAGAFKQQGAFPLQGRHTLTEMLAVAGGLPENASRILRVTRQLSSGPIPLPNARLHADGKSYVADLDTTFADNRSAADDFLLKPYDVVTAFAVEPIVIGGEVTRPGVVPLGDHKSLPLLQVVLMSGGTTRDASRKHVKIFRQDADSARRQELDVDLAKIQNGTAPDFALLPRDLVIVPRANGRMVTKEILAITTGMAVSALTATLVTH